MASLNKVLLIGNLTADIELRQTPSGKSVCSFSIAVNRSFVKDENSQGVDFINVVAWGKQAEFVALYFNKGDPIFVSGRIQVRSWEDSQNDKRYSTEVIAEEFSFVRSKQNNDSDSKKKINSAKKNNVSPKFKNSNTTELEELANDDDLPF